MRPDTYRLDDAAQLASPALVYYLDIIQKNLDSMIRVAGGADRLWPHVKTHKSLDLVRLQMQKGITRFKCATIAEGEMLCMAGAPHALLAYPLVGPNIARFVRLITAYPQTVFYALGEDLGQLTLLSEAAQASGIRVKWLLDVNVGMHRTGVAVKDAAALYRQAAALPGLEALGLHVYDGHRHDTDPAQRQQKADRDMAPVFQLQDTLTQAGLNCRLLVLGGTPSFPCHADREKVYLSPGTSLVHDAGYGQKAPDLPFEPGAAVLTRVVSHPAPGLFTLDLGNKAVAADPAMPRAVILGYEEAEHLRQSEEHLVLQMPPGQAQNRPPIGQALYAIPKHICPTSALYDSILVAQNHQVTASWPVTARNRKLTI